MNLNDWDGIGCVRGWKEIDKPPCNLSQIRNRQNDATESQSLIATLRGSQTDIERCSILI